LIGVTDTKHLPEPHPGGKSFAQKGTQKLVRPNFRESWAQQTWVSYAAKKLMENAGRYSTKVTKDEATALGEEYWKQRLEVSFATMKKAFSKSRKDDESISKEYLRSKRRYQRKVKVRFLPHRSFVLTEPFNRRRQTAQNSGMRTRAAKLSISISYLTLPIKVQTSPMRLILKMFMITTVILALMATVMSNASGRKSIIPGPRTPTHIGETK
jgi:hypothetical protein